MTKVNKGVLRTTIHTISEVHPWQNCITTTMLLPAKIIDPVMSPVMQDLEYDADNYPWPCYLEDLPFYPTLTIQAVTNARSHGGYYLL